MLLSLKDKSRHEKFVCEHGSLWQSWAWGEFQESVGRKVFRFGVDGSAGSPLSGKLVATAQVVQHDLPLGLKYFYVSRGPVTELRVTNYELQRLIDEITSFAKKQGAVFVKMDGIERKQINPKYRVKRSASVQPRHSLVIDLTKSEDEILQLMKQKGRYNVRLAQKRGVELKAVSSKQEKGLRLRGRSPSGSDSKRKRKKGSVSKLVGEFFELLDITTKRDEFRGHGVSYYEKMLEKLGDQAELIMAYYDGQPVAGGIFTFYGKTAVYYYGASSDEYRNVMAPYLVQWTAIQEAKKRGCETYDFLGVAPPFDGAQDLRDDVVDHPWAGVTSFKKKFGGEGVEFSEPFDLVLRPLVYSAYKLFS